MKTYLLGTEDTRAYLLDFLKRLQKWPNIPTVWCSLTESGETLLLRLLELVSEKYPQLLNTVQLLQVEVGENGENIQFLGGDPEEIIHGKSVLLLDGAIHSGRMMGDCADAILKHSPMELTSYALVIKRCSSFFPTNWGITIDETDRAYFMLEEIPNNRLHAGGEDKPQQPVQLRRLNRNHLSQPPLKCSLESINRVTWGDRYFQMEASGGNSCTYVLEKIGEIVGFLTVHSIDSHKMAIDEIVAPGFGGVLMRFADTLARQMNCHFICLNAIKERVEWYKGRGYESVSDKQPLILDHEEYVPMQRKVLYHHPAWR